MSIIDTFKKLLNIRNKDTSIGMSDSNKANQGITLNAHVDVELGVLKFSNLVFELHNETKKIVAESTTSLGEGQYEGRFYTDDDYFFQSIYTGENKIENIELLRIMHYLPELGDSISERNSDDWRAKIEDANEFSVGENIYYRVSDAMSLNESITNTNGDKYGIDNTFALFQRDLTETSFEYIIVNVEQSEDGTLTGTVAVGVDVPFTALSTY